LQRATVFLLTYFSTKLLYKTKRKGREIDALSVNLLTQMVSKGMMDLNWERRRRVTFNEERLGGRGRRPSLDMW
jgi:hypothetical protein